nr:hypothetical protein [Tanacetum cinerariifolium]
MSARIAEAAALSPSSFRKRYRSSYEIPSPSSSLTLPVRKRHMGTSELIKDNEGESSELNYAREGSEDESSDSDGEREGNGLDDEGQGLDDEGQVLEDEGPGMQEATPEGQQQAVLVIDTAASEPLGLRCGAARRHSLESSEEITPSTYETPPSSEWSLGSLPVLPSSSVVPSPIASPVATLAATISRLDVLPPTLFEGYDKDLRELYTRSGAVRDEIFLQRYRFRSLEREQERAMVTFSAIRRPILALEAW